MAINAKRKGANGEREVVKLLQPVVSKVYEEHGLKVIDLERNLMQSLRGGYDITGLDWLALEVKRHENLGLSGINAWWAQARRQAKEGQEAVLFYRPNNVSWFVKMYGYLCVGPNGGYRVRSPVTVDLPTFLIWFELRIRLELKSL